MKALARLCLSAVAVLISASSVHADTHTLSGIVYGGSQPLPGVVVEALEYNTTRVVASSTTNSDGRYAMALSSNTYDLRITPPAGSGYGTEMVRNFAISGEDRVYDILLLSAQPGSLSGTIRGRNGQPVPNATIYVNIDAFSEATTTDAAGQYAINTINGRVFLQVFGSGPGSVAPENWYIERYDVIISGPTVFNLDLPVSQLNGVVRFNDGTPAPGAVLDLVGFGTVTNGRTYSTASATADINGLYSVLMLDGSVRGVATPPPGALVPQATETFTIAGDTGQNFTFPSASRVTGTIRGRNGLAVSNATVYISVGSTVATAVTDANGQYILDAENGPAYLQIWGGGPSGAAPSSFYLERYDVTINGTTQVDVTLPVVRIAGAVKDAEGGGVVGATVSLSTSNSPDNGRSTSYETLVSGDNGAYEGLVLAGAGIASVTPPPGSSLTPVTRSFDATADAQLDFTLPPTTLIAGTVRARDGQPVPGATVTVIVGSETSAGQTDSTGHYSLSVPAGTATVQVTGGGSAGAPDIFSFERDGVDINGPTTFDVNLSVALLNGTVTDANGVLVPTVPFTAATTNALSNGHTTSSSSGVGGTNATFSALALTGAGTLTLSPLFDTGFIETTLPFDLPGDASGRFALLHGGVAPVITMGPVIVHLSDTSVTIGWTTNRESTSIVEFGEGGILSQTSEDAALTTEHLITLTGLAPSTQYDFRVGSSDAFGTGPALSATAALVTLSSPGDFGSPIITAGPLVFADQTSAIIEWTTDEPASSIVEFGTPRVAVDGDPGAFRLRHRVRLTGLSPDTDYPANVRSADPSGNETVGGDFTFHTPAAADALPPAITDGPTVIAKSDTRIVIGWTTNEPATTGVSYNDGTAYDLGTDLALTRTHRMTLAGLSAGTLYHITVSSTDAAGNGPTLSAAFDVTTDATADTTPPTAANVQVTNVTATRAVITWTTDEPANAVVVFAAAGNTGNVQGDLDLTLAHEQAPNGLLPETEYRFFLFSTDVAGNFAEVGSGSFTTQPLTVDNPPSKPTNLSGPTSPTREATIHLTWNESSDDHGVTGYEVRRDGVAIGTVDANTLSFDDTTAAEGSHTYEVGALDAVGHITLSDPLTIVVDRTAPVVTVPGDILADAVGTTATVTFTATATDNFDPSVAVTCTPPSGSAFSVGTTPVSCSASDTAGNTGTATFNVIVRDVTAPVVTVPSDITREATSPAGAVVTFTATAFDVVDGSIAPTCTPASGATFQIGLTQVMCTATDAAGNTGQATFNVIVVDSTAPVITQFSPSLSVLTPPDHRMVNLTINLTVTDASDPSPVCSIIAISSNEPMNGTGDGDTAPDWSFSGLTFSLRAERSGSGNGRIYTIYGECRDSAGNVSHATTTVSVPK